MTHRTFIAVDPGGSGAVAWSNRRGTFVKPMPETRAEVIGLIRDEALDEAVEPVAYMEKVAAFIPDGGASMMFEYGRQIERVGCILELLQVRIIEIRPQAWQSELSLGKSDRMTPPRMPDNLTGKEKAEWKYKNSVVIARAKAHNALAKRDWKNKLKAEAERRFPDQNVTLRTCDALLLLDVAIKLEGMKLNL